MKSLIYLLILFTPAIAQAALTADFQDLTPGTVYPHGSVINSGDLSFNILPFGQFPGQFVVQHHVTSGNKQIFTGRTGLEFLLPTPATRIDFDYQLRANSVMTINGVTASSINSSFTSLDGTSVGGVLISLDASPTIPLRDGKLFLRGDIQSFVIAGSEFGVDNARVFIPEPSAFALTLLVASCATLSRRRAI